MTASDAMLLQQYIKTNSAEAFDELVKRHAGLVYSVCLRISNNRQDAEDVAQDCFLEMAKKAASIHTSLSGWLHRVARCKAINLIQSSVARHNREAKVGAENAQERFEPSGIEMSWGAVKISLDEAIDSLPDELRIPIVMHYLERMSQEKVADMLGMNQSTVSRHIEHGVDLLRAKLKEAGCTVTVTSLSAMLLTSGVESVPGTLWTALGKMAIVGIDRPAVASPGSAFSGGSALKIVAAVVLVVGIGGGVIAVKQGRLMKVAPVGSLVPTAGNNGSSGTLLGSPAFVPSPEQPLGWRGDNSGRYQGARPSAVEWRRRVSCLSYDLRCQAGKPKDGTGEPVVNQFPFRYRAIKEWLIAGPFTMKEGATVDTELAPNEASLEPDAGDKIGDVTWVKWEGKPWLLEGWGRSTLPSSKESIMPDLKGKDKETASIATMPETEVGFTEVCAGATGPLAAYAHAYLYAPRAGTIGLLINPGASIKVPIGIKMWMNGKLLFSQTGIRGFGGEKSTDRIEVQKGWNRLLCKMTATGLAQMRLDVRLWPNYEDLSYEVKNIAWMTPLPCSSPQAPLIFGGRIYLNTDNNELICMDMDGKVQWLKTTHPYYTLTDDEKKASPAIKDKVEPLIAKMEETDRQIVAEMNAWRAANTPASKVLADKVGNLSSAKVRLWRDSQKEMLAIDAGKYFANHFGATSSGGAGSFAVCTDGKHLCDFYASGFASCYDLQGNRKWTRGIDPERRPHGPEHGNNSSGVIADGNYIVFFADQFTAFDLETGKVAWTAKGSGTYQSLVLTKIGKTQAVIDPNFRNIVRAKDGKILWTGKEAFNTYAPTVVIDNRVVYTLGGPNVKGPLAVKLPDSEDELGQNLKPLFRFEKTAFGVPSPLVHDGLLYGNDIYGSLSVADIAGGKLVYRRQLDLHHYIHLRDGVFCSPALGGDKIYLSDNNCSTIVIEPGREFKVLAQNILDYARPPKYGPARIQDRSGGAGHGLVFNGDKTYFRAESFLYCIGAK